MSKILATNSFLIRSRETVIRYLTRRQKRKSSYTARYRSIFIIPTLAGIGCATLLMSMLILATNFGNNMVFALDFMLGSLWFVALYGTHHNLLHLRLEALPCMPVFSGDNARFKIRITNPSRTTRYGIRWLSQNHGGILAEIPARGSVLFEVVVPTRSRGWLRAPRFSIQTTYPFGWFRAWNWIELDTMCLVYPAPVSIRSIAQHVPGPDEGQDKTLFGEQEWAGLRAYQQGDPARAIVWRALAREAGLYVHQMADSVQHEVWLEWDALAPMETELRLRVLCQRILECSEKNLRYGLRLPTQTFDPEDGAQHRLRSLRALALFGMPPSGGKHG